MNGRIISARLTSFWFCTTIPVSFECIEPIRLASLARKTSTGWVLRCNLRPPPKKERNRRNPRQSFLIDGKEELLDFTRGGNDGRIRVTRRLVCGIRTRLFGLLFHLIPKRPAAECCLFLCRSPTKLIAFFGPLPLLLPLLGVCVVVKLTQIPRKFYRAKPFTYT